MRFGWLLLVLLMQSSFAAEQAALLSAVWAEEYLKQHDSHLLDDSEHDHVMSLYYFGDFEKRRLMGLERVRGEDYEQYFTLLLFEETSLVGYYQNVLSFPSSIDKNGQVHFPLGITGQMENSKKLLNIGWPLSQYESLCLQQKTEVQCNEWHLVQ